MKPKDLSLSFKKYQVFLWLFLAYILSLSIVFNKNLRESWRSQFLPAKRHVLAVASASMFANKNFHRVTKIMTPTGIAVEVYGPIEQGVQPLIDVILIPDKKDAYFDLHGRATNLALKDMNADGQPEIIAPSYDEDGVAHLNVYSYSENAKKFIPYLE